MIDSDEEKEQEDYEEIEEEGIKAKQWKRVGLKQYVDINRSKA